jgi:hypothetical protein
MSEQRCWDCAHGKQIGPGSKTGRLQKMSRVVCNAPLPYWVDDSLVAGNCNVRWADEIGGDTCSCFKPREGVE